MMEPETCEYLDGEWRTHKGERSGHVYVIGSDGDSLFTCDSYSAAHFLTPEAVAEYLIEQHGAAKRLAARERDIERAVTTAISTLYFADNSDYQSALWSVVSALNPETAELLENDEAAAYAKYCEALEKPEATR